MGARLSARLSPRSPAPQKPTEAPSPQQLQPRLCSQEAAIAEDPRCTLPGNRMLPEHYSPPGTPDGTGRATGGGTRGGVGGHGPGKQQRRAQTGAQRARKRTDGRED